MKYLLVSIRDRALDAFQTPWATRAIGEAIRGFQDAINDPKNATLHAHPDDYDLYVIATFDDSTGQIEQTAEHPKQIAIGKQLKITA